MTSLRPTAERDRTSVAAVIVTFHAEPTAVAAVLEAVAGQVDGVVVIDNASPAPIVQAIETAAARHGAEVVCNPANVGLAAAQNAGIDWARRQGHTHVLLLDQDSVAGPGMVDALVRAWRAASAVARVGAVGPRFHDPREADWAPFVRVAFPRSARLRCGPQCTRIGCDFLISSGLLIPLDVVDDVGAMEDELFIDNVDLDWSFRARARGWQLYGVCDAGLEHRLGDSRVRVLGGTVVRHGPMRLYYMMRNRVALYRRPHTPRVWVAQDVPRVFVKFLIFAVFVGPRPANVRYMLRGLADGLRGRLGPCPIVPRPMAVG